MFLAPVFPQADLPSVYWWGFFPMQQLFESIAPCLPGLGWGLLGDFGDPKGSFFLSSGCSAQLCLLRENSFMCRGWVSVPVYMIICVCFECLCVWLCILTISVCIFVGVGGLSPSVRPFVLHISMKCAFSIKFDLIIWLLCCWDNPSTSQVWNINSLIRP